MSKKQKTYSKKRLLAIIAILALLVLSVFILYYNQKPSDEKQRLLYLQNLINEIDGNVTSNYIITNNIKTHYIESGKGETIILIHGAGQGGITWYPIIRELSKNYNVIVPDVPGYGESDKPDASYDSNFFANWLKSFLDSKNLTKVHLIGLSQGGAISIHFTSKYPDYVDKLILVDSAGFGDVPSDIIFGMFILNTAPSYTLQKIANSYLFYNTSKINDNFTRYGVEVLRMSGGKNPFWQGRGKIAEKISQDVLENIRKETLIIWGDSDKFFSIEQAKDANNMIKKSKLIIIEKAGHIPFVDQPEEFTQSVLDFLKN